MSVGSSTIIEDFDNYSDDDDDFEVLGDVIPMSDWQLLSSSMVLSTYKGALVTRSQAPMTSVSVAFRQAAPSLKSSTRTRSKSAQSTTSTKASSVRNLEQSRSIVEDSYSITEARTDKYVRKLRGLEEKSRQGHLHRVHDVHYCRQCLNRYWPRHFKTCPLCEKAGGRYAWKGHAEDGINAVNYYSHGIEMIHRREGRTRLSRWKERQYPIVG
ncbi:hypothetical protein FOL47_000400 [Perkinsus chesapeaki]|uniref:Uncharacterized protein n=1 Tax=Perkinsus chesapeaki TaxID=330153 RepID=A0A7J6MM01_PERCH|nr:hypothetical protein FOL47_000400 [Perkinsus chesapeaki]